MSEGVPISNGSVDIKGETVAILHVGRITQIKNIDTLVETAKILREKWNRKFKIILAGGSATKQDVAYSKKIDHLIQSYGLEGSFEFLGKVSYQNIATAYSKADISVNLTPTGGVDKSVLESMASGLIPFTSNTAFTDYFGDLSDSLIFSYRDANDLAQKIISVYEENDLMRIKTSLLVQVSEKSDVGVLISKVVQFMANLKRFK